MPDRRPTRTTIRWWPAIATLALVAVALAVIWLRPAPSTQDRVVPTFPVLFLGALLLVIWVVFLSRLARKIRVTIFLVVALVVGLAFTFLEIQGVDGNLVPIVGFKKGSKKDGAVEQAPVTAEELPATPDSPAPPTEPEPPGPAGEAPAVAQATAAPGGPPPVASPPVAAGPALPGLPAGPSAPGLPLPGPTDYPQFYGPHRDATLPGPRLARDWQANPPRELWRRPVGEGWSSFAVVGDAALTQEQRGQDEVVARYELETGREIWAHADRAPFDTTVGGRGPRATPTVAEGRVFALGATGLLSCLELAGGRLVWQRDVLRDNGARQPSWGMASSPLVVGGVVIVQLGRGGTSLAAYDRATGEPAWRAGSDQGSYSSPTVATLAGRVQVLIVNQTSVAGHDPATGEQLWSHQWPDPGGEKITPPLPLGDDRLLVSAGYGVGSRLLRIEPAGDRFAVELVWESPRLKSKFAPLVTREGTVYGLDDGVLTALDPATGERRWKAGRYGHGQLLLVDDLLLIQAENGDVVLVEASPRGHRELARLAALEGKTWNPPALSGRRLLVRNNREAACYELPVDG